MSDEVYLIEAEVTAHGFNVLDVVMHAAGDLGGVVHEVGVASAARVEQDHGVIGGQLLKTAQMDGVRDQHGGGAIAELAGI